jgi:hypothetical protein
MSGRFAKIGIQRNERSQVRTAFLSCVLLAGSHPVRLLFGAQSLSGRQLRNHGPESDTQSLTSRALFLLGTAPAVGYESNSEVGARDRHVRFPPDSDKTADIAGGPFRATSRLMHRSKMLNSITSPALAIKVDPAVQSDEIEPTISFVVTMAAA